MELFSVHANFEVARTNNTIRMQDLGFVLQARPSLSAHESESMLRICLVCREKQANE
jgi:hypothetical protein